VKILDFGLARPETGGDQISTTGAVVGTPAYMAPEQAHGRKVDFRADLFSLGCVLYEITTGRRAFSGETNLAVLMSIASDNPPSPHDLAHVDRRLSDLTMQLLEKDPLRRPASAAIVQRLLAGIEMSQASGRIAPGPAQSRTLPRFLSERYELTTRLAETDMFTVYKAFDNAIGSNVAVKVLDSELSLDRSNVQLFHALVKNLQTIKNYHVVPILDFGEHNGELYCVMPLLDGQTLTERLKSEQLDVPHAVAIGRQIANGLEAIHERRLVHRSIQPANIWLKSQSEPDAPKLLRVDAIIIGFAATQLPQDRMAYTERGKRVVEGTPGCAAPEQVNGRVVDNRADIFSFGTLLYVLLTGQKPFPSRGWHQYIASLCSVVPAPPVDVAPRVPKELSSLVMQMMAIRKEERPKSAAVVSMELAAIEDQFSKD
jgi:serine/threonine protein kinase